MIHDTVRPGGVEEPRKMNNGRKRAVFAIHVTVALLTVTLLALDMVEVEAALTNGKMLSLQVNNGRTPCPPMTT
jgi:hypothetical protein